MLLHIWYLVFLRRSFCAVGFAGDVLYLRKLFHLFFFYCSYHAIYLKLSHIITFSDLYVWRSYTLCNWPNISLTVCKGRWGSGVSFGAKWNVLGHILNIEVVSFISPSTIFNSRTSNWRNNRCTKLVGVPFDRSRRESMSVLLSVCVLSVENFQLTYSYGWEDG